jgi:hypothetical protein
MTKSYIVSGHGVRYADDRFTVPPFVEIHFYFTRRTAPQIYRARTALDKLMVEIGMFPDYVATAGEVIPAYFCWPYATGTPSSGVFRRSTGQLAMDLSGASAQRPVALGHIVREFAAQREQKLTALHWLARTEEAAGTSIDLDCIAPPRLPSNSGGDGAESTHVPLTRF